MTDQLCTGSPMRARSGMEWVSGRVAVMMLCFVSAIDASGPQRPPTVALAIGKTRISRRRLVKHCVVLLVIPSCDSGGLRTANGFSAAFAALACRTMSSKSRKPELRYDRDEIRSGPKPPQQRLVLEGDRLWSGKTLFARGMGILTGKHG